MIRENSSIAIDQVEYAKKENNLYDLYDEKKAQYDELESKLQEKHGLKENIEHFKRALQDLDGQETEFDETLLGGLIDRIVIQEDKTATVVFKGGIEVPVK